MRLKCIKLSGFKSFVDPTTVYFPSNMCGVVGPNGCGKSNIIDAVRWVMGESSAKNLRGDSMTDVIFKGSNSRKPASYAHVELVFDNNEGRITGEYAAYSEISVKRKLTSDAQNTYFLNGNKCRRKDIMDIFLGTGLGPRSYAIISQGIISNLIESKPEELRVFIEEAAGISRYKERRRETENRLRRTNENLERLTDLREELERQLSHLKRQAEAAEKYKEFKQEERLKRAQLHALRWQGVDSGAKSQESAIREFEIRLEAAIAKQRSSDTDIEKLRQSQTEYADSFNKVQSRYYSTGNEITKLEQTIAHRRERADQLSRDLQEAEAAWRENRENLESDQVKLEQLEEEVLSIEPELELSLAGEEEHAMALMEAEESMQTWQHAWDEFNHSASESRREAEIEQSKIQHLEQVLDRLEERLRKHQEEMSGLQAEPVEEEIELLTEQLTELELQIESLQHTQEETGDQIHTVRQAIADATKQKDDCSRRLNEARGRFASLQALQQAALGHSDGGIEWLAGQGLAEQPRLGQQIKVKPGWETAVETVLGDYLQAVCVDDVDAVATVLDSMVEANLTFLAANTIASSTRKTMEKATALIDCVEGAEAAETLLQGIYGAITLDEALALRPNLAPGESVVTQDGVWLGANWLRVIRENDAGTGILARQQEIESLELELAELDDQEQTLTESLAESRERLEQLEQAREDGQRQLSTLNRQESELQSDLTARKVRVEQLLTRYSRLQEEISEIEEQQALEQEAMGESRLRLQEALDCMEGDAERRETLLSRRDEIRADLDRIRQTARHSKDMAHQLELRKQSLTAQIDSMRQAVERLKIQGERLDERLGQLRENLAQSDDPVEDLQIELEELLAQRVEVEEEMMEARRLLEDVEHQMRDYEKNRGEAEHEAQLLRDRLEKLRMDWQALQVRRTTLQEQLEEDQFDLETVLANMPDEATETAWEEALERLETRIQRLGAINLAAIEEYEQQSERKRYLDAQNDDLAEAIATLEGAIRKIDKETRNRFQHTFERVNSGLQELFPKVFGGGRAYLELTGDDLLNTGVAIMAQPPGKKNSTIHLLSGGEKALTAIALVFAIFQLNPSPFCMLDEVDAPLDDANVGRYARMVTEMSEKVQFIYISHNKIAMEAANQLIGVTMHEPGVSRPVSVDIEQAAVLAAV
ncbi:MAG: chromosome segregation protein SMC [Oceanospirillales bacterium LUC14_002_19_P2]|nr:MAG: chromosome segregation protein SMC [Oceanospirillales bacterium LUC14_002_19_P2]